jgi:hypothetical protein
MSPEIPPGSADDTGPGNSALNLVALALGLILVIPFALLAAAWFYLVALKECVLLLSGSAKSDLPTGDATPAVPAPHIPSELPAHPPPPSSPQGFGE